MYFTHYPRLTCSLTLQSVGLPFKEIVNKHFIQRIHTAATKIVFEMLLKQNVLLKILKFKVCKSVHHRTIQINHQPDATIFHFIILTFIYSSTCFGRFPARHQELNDCSGSLWFYLRIVVIVVLCSWSGRPAVIELLMMMGGKTPETCWAVKRQDNKLKNCCIRLVIYLNCTMMHGLANLKSYI